MEIKSNVCNINAIVTACKAGRRDEFNLRLPVTFIYGC